MSTNQQHHDSDAPEPDVTKAGVNLSLAMIFLMVLIGISWVSLSSLFKASLSEQRERVSGTVTGSVSAGARSASLARAQASGVDELEDGTKVGYVPVSRASELLLGSPDALRGNGKWTNVDGGDVASIGALPSFAAVLDPAVAEAEAAAAAVEADATDEDTVDAAADDAVEAPAVADDAGANEAPADAAE